MGGTSSCSVELFNWLQARQSLCCVHCCWETGCKAILYRQELCIPVCLFSQEPGSKTINRSQGAPTEDPQEVNGMYRYVRACPVAQTEMRRARQDERRRHCVAPVPPRLRLDVIAPNTLITLECKRTKALSAGICTLRQFLVRTRRGDERAFSAGLNEGETPQPPSPNPGYDARRMHRPTEIVRFRLEKVPGGGAQCHSQSSLQQVQ